MHRRTIKLLTTIVSLQRIPIPSTYVLPTIKIYVCLYETHNQKRMLFLQQTKAMLCTWLYTYIYITSDKNGLLEFTKQYFFGFFAAGPRPAHTRICVRCMLLPHACYSCYTLYFVKVFSRRKSIEKKKLKKHEKVSGFRAARIQRKRISRRCRFSRCSCSRKKYVGRSTFNFYAIFNMCICVSGFVQLKVGL